MMHIVGTFALMAVAWVALEIIGGYIQAWMLRRMLRNMGQRKQGRTYEAE